MAEQSLETNISTGSSLCMSCGICCTGHLFPVANIKPSEAKTAQNLGLTVQQLDQETYAFQLPCPHWRGCCTIYTHPQKPSVCSDFKCKLLLEVEGELVDLNEALNTVYRVKGMIREIEKQIPAEQDTLFYNRLFRYNKQMDGSGLQPKGMEQIRLKAGVVLVMFMKKFGISGLFSNSVME